MKIVLGTANLNESYGILKQRTSLRHSIKMLNYIHGKINEIDTASSYKGFNSLAKNYDLKKIKINTKIGSFKSISYKKLYEQISSEIEYLLKIYKKKNINILFLHRPNIILSKHQGKNIIKIIKKLKKEKKIKYFGYSVYSPSETKKLIKKFKPDYIQGPLSLFDQRMIDKGILNLLKNKKIKFQARSIFLQGILTDQRILLNKKFIKNKDILKKWYQWLELKKYNAKAVLINFIKLKKNYIDSVIFSCQNINQLKTNFKEFKKKTNKKLFQIGKIENNIVDPRKWNYN